MQLRGTFGADRGMLDAPSSAKLQHVRNNNNIRDLYRGINELQKGYHPRVKDERGHLIVDPHKILNR
jgi:hypothetical protein